MRRAFPILAALYLALIFFRAAPALHDESEAYYQYGVNLLETGTYGNVPGVSDNLREPGYGFFLATLLAPELAAEKALGFSAGTETRLRWIVTLQAMLFLLCLAFFRRAAELPPRLRDAFTLLTLLSPTLWGAHADIYSETLTIDLALVLLTLVSRADFAAPRRVALAAAAGTWLLLTKLYLMYLYPLALLAGGWAAYRRRVSPRLLAPPLVALLVLGLWGLRPVSRAQGDHVRTIVQLAGKVYRHRTWDLAREWQPALLASCCLNTCVARYGSSTCDKFAWTGSDGIGYALIQDWKDHPEKHRKDLLVEVLETWATTLPWQLVSSGLEVLRMAFFEAATVSPESPGWWRLLAQLWHLLGSLGVLGLAVVGWRDARRGPDPGVRRAWLLGTAFVGYHVLFMAQVTNVQRYTVPVLPWVYLFAACALARLVPAKRA